MWKDKQNQFAFPENIDIPCSQGFFVTINPIKIPVKLNLSIRGLVSRETSVVPHQWGVETNVLFINRV